MVDKKEEKKFTWIQLVLSIATIIFVSFLGAFFIDSKLFPTGYTNDSSTDMESKSYDPVTAEGFEYIVTQAYETKRLGDEEGNFIIVAIKVKNNWSEPRSPSVEYLIVDDQGKKYATDPMRNYNIFGSEYDIFGNLNPGISQTVRMSFLVPKIPKHYSLVIKDSFLFDRELATVKLR